MREDNPGNQIATLKKRQDDVNAMFQVNKGTLAKMAPQSLDPQRLMYIAYNTIVQNPKLLLCSRDTLLAGVIESVKLGLQLGGPLQEAHLIPYGNKATLVIGFMGYRTLIDRSGSVKALHPYAVHNGMRLVKTRPREFEAGTPDEFDWWLGDEPRVIHRPKNPFPEFKEQLHCVYVAAQLRGGGKQIEVLMPEEIEAHRNRSRAKDDGPWVTDYVPMALKTAIRKIAKYLPKATIPRGVAEAMAIDDRADRGESLPLPEGFTLPPAADEPAQAGEAKPAGQSQTDRVREKLGGSKQDATPAAEAPPLTDADIPWGTQRPG